MENVTDIAADYGMTWKQVLAIVGVLSGYVQNVNVVETLRRPGPVISAQAEEAGRPCPGRTARSVSDA